MGLISFDDIFEEELKDPEFRKYFVENKIQVEIGVSLLKARESVGLSRKKLAKVTGLSVKNVKEAEQGDNFDASIKLITKLMSLARKSSENK